MLLNDRQTQWLKNHYRNTKNADIANKFGISIGSVVIYGRNLGLSKSPRFLKKIRLEAVEAARKANLLREYDDDFKIPGGEKHQFKPGVPNVKKIGRAAERKRIKAVIDSRNETIRKERARIAFGLPQKTKLKIGRQPRAKVELRYYLKKRGYIVDDEKRIAFYTPNTQRGKRVEARDQRWYKFQPYESAE